MTPENQVKLALLEEYKRAVRYQEFYYQECEVLSSLIQRAIQYYQRQGLEIPNRQELYRLVEVLQGVVDKHGEFKKSVLSDDTYQHKNPTGTDQNQNQGEAQSQEPHLQRVPREVRPSVMLPLLGGRSRVVDCQEAQALAEEANSFEADDEDGFV